MHTLLPLSGLLLALLASTLALGLLGRVRGWPRRRGVQVLVLAVPAAALALGLGGVVHFAGRACFVGAPRWDRLLAVALPAAMALAALGGLGLGLVRLTLLARVVGRCDLPAGPDLEAVVAGLAGRLGVAPPRIRLCAYNRPLALACGLRRPTIVLSTWMVTRLDRRELEAVLAHELAHVARRDVLVAWLTTILRDAFWYLPTSWAAHRLLQGEQELACDDLTVGVTRRPLALASALAKVWAGALGAPLPGAARPLLGASGAIEGRIARLLALPAASPAEMAEVSGGTMAHAAGAAALLALLTIELAALALFLAPMGCGPAVLWG